MSTFRDQAIAEVIHLLPRRSARFVRLLESRAQGTFPREMAELLAGVEDGTKGITELGEQEGFAQPRTTRMVIRLEALGLVTRTRESQDRRYVAVEITPAGRRELQRLRAQDWGVNLKHALEALSDGEVAGLAAAADTLQRVIDSLVAIAPRNGDADTEPDM